MNRRLVLSAATMTSRPANSSVEERQSPRKEPWRRDEFLPGFAVAAVLLVVVAAIVWASRRGFDQTDEGAYLLSYATKSRVLSASQWQKLVAFFIPSSAP